jgi:hypothetical protein
MPRSESGRVVIDLDPEFKKELYSALKEDDSNLKAWFVERATDYVEDKRQPSLFGGKSMVTEPQKEYTLPPVKRKGVAGS